jgi:hypothetical protein
MCVAKSRFGSQLKSNDFLNTDLKLADIIISLEDFQN